MARTIEIIQQSILDAKAASPSLSAMEVLTTAEKASEAPTSTSKLSFWRIVVWVVAYAIWLHEVIVEANALKSRPHNIPWYRDQAFAFLDGLPLVWKDGQFTYDLTGVNDAEERKIIDRCAVLESDDGQLVFKIATDVAGVIQPVAPDELVRFTAYMQQIKDAGNQISIVNQTADLLKLVLDVYVDPLVIDLATGELLSSAGVFPVKDAVNDYLSNLEFNGAWVRSFLQDTIQKADGVKLPLINDAQWKYAGFAFTPIGEWKVPQAGYFKIAPGDLIINYYAYDLANG